MMTGYSGLAFFPFILFFIYLILIALGVTVLVLLIRVLLRAIRALDLYIEEKTNRRL